MTATFISFLKSRGFAQLDGGNRLYADHPAFPPLWLRVRRLGRSNPPHSPKGRGHVSRLWNGKRNGQDHPPPVLPHERGMIFLHYSLDKWNNYGRRYSRKIFSFFTVLSQIRYGTNRRGMNPQKESNMRFYLGLSLLFLTCFSWLLFVWWGVFRILFR